MLFSKRFIITSLRRSRTNKKRKRVTEFKSSERKVERSIEDSIRNNSLKLKHLRWSRSIKWICKHFKIVAT
jgi:hypothetical protein